jgi:hypothetical protein
MSRFSLFLLLPFLGILGCRTARPADITGTWAITDQSRHKLPLGLQGAAGRLIVYADGTFGATELPEAMSPIDEKPRFRLNSGGGRWSLARWDGAQHLELEFHDLISGDTDDRTRFGFPIEISRGWSAWSLYYFLGDPDDAPRLNFTRREPRLSPDGGS